MSEYRLFETITFRRNLDRLGPAAAKRIRDTLTERVYPVLRANPRQVPSAARLKEWDPPTWRIRIGTWRVFYEIDDASRIVSLTAADHRKGAYR
ncbi:MAG: type II toxin-antitoxin system RelE family toxin [Thermoanaerobaculia bacterium]